MSPTSTTPEDLQLPKPADVKDESLGDKRTLDDQLDDKKKIDEYDRHKIFHDTLIKTMTIFIFPGSLVMAILLLFFCVYLAFIGKAELVYRWVELAFAFLAGNLFKPYLFRLLSDKEK